MRVREIFQENSKPVVSATGAKTIETFLNDYIPEHHGVLVKKLILSNLDKSETQLIKNSELTFTCFVEGDHYRCVCTADAVDYGDVEPDYETIPIIYNGKIISEYPGDWPISVKVAFKLTPKALTYIATYPLQRGTPEERLSHLVDEFAQVTSVSVEVSFDETRTWDINGWDIWHQHVIDKYANF